MKKKPLVQASALNYTLDFTVTTYLKENPRIGLKLGILEYSEAFNFKL